MKKELLRRGAYVMLLFMMAACSKNQKMSNLLERIPADADVVVVGDVKTIVESAGGTVDGALLKLPSYLTSQLPESDAKDMDKFEAFIKNSGVDAEACALVMSYKDGRPIIVFALDDKSKFIKAIEDENFREKDDEDGVTYYSKKVYSSEYDSSYDDYGYIAVKDSYAYWIQSVWVGSDFKPMKAIRRLIDDASEKSFADTKFSGYITDGSVAGVALKIPRELRRELSKAGVPDKVADIYEGVLCMKGALTDNSATINMKLFGEDGKEKSLDGLSKYMNLKAKVSTKALSYMNKDEVLVYAVSVKDVDWDSYLDMMADAAKMSRSDRSMMNIAKSYLEKIDGTIAVGVGVSNGFESMFNLMQEERIMEELALTMVCETKSGKAKGLVNDIKGLLDAQHVEYSDRSAGFVLTIPGDGGSIYVEAKDDVLVFSNREIKDNNKNLTVEGVNFGKNIATAGLVMNKNNPLMRDLGIDYDLKMAVTYDAQSFEAIMTMELNGGDTSIGVIGKLMKTVFSIAGQGGKFEQKWREVRRGYADQTYDEVVDSVAVYDDWDDVVVDSAAVVE